MLQLRPTFSESWYRVATLKPRLRAGAQISRQYYRGDRWYVVRDPAGNQFHRLSDPAYRFVGLLNGRRTIAEAWDLVGGQLADDAPTQPEVIQILSQLYGANLLETDITPDATVLLRRHKKMSQQKLQGKLMNMLFPRLPLWDPDSFLRRWMPVMRQVFSKIGMLLWLIVVGAAIATLIPRIKDIEAANAHAFDLKTNWENLFWLYATFVFIKLIHELGHAFACRRFGGEVHELGIMLLVLVPTPYVDASTAWAFPSRWQRVFVGAAGMIVELFFAAICAFIWVYTNPDTLLNQIAYNAMFIASVSTIIFNANPLLRYDGYYILSDLLEIPNLRQKSTEYALGLIKRHVFRLKMQQPLPPVRQRIWLLSYAIASSIYRVFVGVMIIVVVTFKVPVLGILMAFGGVATWLLVPVFKVGKYVLLEPELHRKRGRAILFATSVMAALVVLIGLVPFPMHVRFTGILEPDDPVDSATHRVISGKLITSEPGRVSQILVKDNDPVKAGQTIMILTDPKTEQELAVAEANIAQANDRIRQYRVEDMIQYKQARDDLAVWEGREADAKDKLNRMIITAPFDGRLVARLHEMQNVYLPRGQEIGSVAVLDHLVVRGDIEQNDAELVQRGPALDSHGKVIQPQVRLAGTLEQAPLTGLSLEIDPSATTELPSPSLGSVAGGDLQTDPHDSKGLKTVAGVFETRVKLDNPDLALRAGQRAYVRLTLDSKPLIWQWTRSFLQLLQTSDSGKWL